MFHLETELAQWREEMRSAGIAPGRVLAELESHLRDDFDRALKAGTDPVAAFAAARAALGPAHALKREFDVSSPRTIASIFRAPIPLFPTNLRRCAFGALFFGPWLMISVEQNIANNWVGGSGHLAFEFLTNGFNLVPALFGALGLVSAIGYLWSPGYRFASLLAVFWIFWTWSLGWVLVMTLVYGLPFAISVSNWAFGSMLTGALAIFYFWNKALRGEAKKGNAPRADEQRLAS